MEKKRRSDKLNHRLRDTIDIMPSPGFTIQLNISLSLELVGTICLSNRAHTSTQDEIVLAKFGPVPNVVDKSLTVPKLF